MNEKITWRTNLGFSSFLTTKETHRLTSLEEVYFLSKRLNIATNWGYFQQSLGEILFALLNGEVERVTTNNKVALRSGGLRRNVPSVLRCLCTHPNINCLEENEMKGPHILRKWKLIEAIMPESENNFFRYMVHVGVKNVKTKRILMQVIFWALGAY